MWTRILAKMSNSFVNNSFKSYDEWCFETANLTRFQIQLLLSEPHVLLVDFFRPEKFLVRQKFLLSSLIAKPFSSYAPHLHYTLISNALTQNSHFWLNLILICLTEFLIKWNLIWWVLCCTVGYLYVGNYVTVIWFFILLFYWNNPVIHSS